MIGCIKMKVGIDGRKLSENKTGIGNYLESMLVEILKIDKNNDYYIFSDKPISSIFNADNVYFVEINKYRKIFKYEQLYQPIWMNFLLKPYLQEYKIDVFWGPNFIRPLLFPSQQSIITIHDLAFIDAKEYHSKIHSLYLRIFLRLSVMGQTKILTVSNYSKDTISKHYSNIKGDVGITYCSYNINLFNGNYTDTDREMIKVKHNLPEKYVLFVGTTTARKNLLNVIKSIKYSIDNNKVYCDLVVVGAKGNGLTTLTQFIKKLGIESHVHFLGYIEDEDLPYLYNMAEIFVFPSYFEGFGIPILEAMASGTPVITSDVTSLPEVSGNAAHLVNPSKPEDISFGIETILNNVDVRSQMVSDGYQRIKLFKWKNSAEVFVNTLKEIQNDVLIEER